MKSYCHVCHHNVLKSHRLTVPPDFHQKNICHLSFLLTIQLNNQNHSTFSAPQCNSNSSFFMMWDKLEDESHSILQFSSWCAEIKEKMFSSGLFFVCINSPRLISFSRLSTVFNFRESLICFPSPHSPSAAAELLYATSCAIIFPNPLQTHSETAIKRAVKNHARMTRVC